MNLLKDKKHIHFIGIGGSGMYPLVQILNSEGYHITGSDNNMTDTVQTVQQMGIQVSMEQKASNIEGADLIVHTAAIMEDNPELIGAKASGVTVAERSELLGEITARYSEAICVAGTHGKTTVSSMITQILFEGGFDPTAVIGGKLPVIGGNGRAGKSEFMVCEACEFVDTFLKLSADTVVLINIDQDHMDYFKTMDNMIKSFQKFSQGATKRLVVNGDDPNVLKAIQGVTQEVVRVGKNADNDYSYGDIVTSTDKIGCNYKVYRKGEYIRDVEISVAGEHNVFNSIIAIVTAIETGVDIDQAITHIKNFTGASRRFDLVGKERGVSVVDDYAHHPAEIDVTIDTARALGYKRVIAVHQPFTYTRTHLLMDDFAETLSKADICVLSEIMGSREKNTLGIYAKDLADKIDGCVWFDGFEEIADYVCSIVQEGDLVLTMGCGDVYKVARMIVDRLK